MAASKTHGMFVAPSTKIPSESCPTPASTNCKEHCNSTKNNFSNCLNTMPLSLDGFLCFYCHYTVYRVSPCICTKNSVLILLALSDSLSDLDEQSESTSSMKIMLGLCALANSNRFLTSFSDSPSHFDTKSDDDTEKNVELFASVATALARYDLPVPGGWGVQCK